MSLQHCHYFAHTLCIRDLDELNLIWPVDFRLKLNFATALDARKNIAYFRSGQKRPENYNLASFIKVKSKSLMHTVFV